MQCELAGVLSQGRYEQNRRVYKTGGAVPDNHHSIREQSENHR